MSAILRVYTTRLQGFLFCFDTAHVPYGYLIVLNDHYTRVRVANMPHWLKY